MAGRVWRGWFGVMACVSVLLATAGSAHAGQRACDLPLSPGEQTVALTNQGEDRPFLLYVPDGYNGDRKLPLILNLHPSGGNGPQQMGISQMAQAADERDVIVAAPNGGVDGDGEAHFWNVPGVPLVGGTPVPEGAPNDQRYLLAVIKKAQRTACINPDRVHMTGFSGGARMSSQMACDYSNKIAAIAPVGGLRAGIPKEVAPDVWKPIGKSCQPERPMPVVAFHGTADNTNPYPGNDDSRWGYSVESALARWAKVDGCRRGPSTALFAPTVNTITYRKCRGAADVQLFQVEGGKHVWFGDDTVDATDTMLQFFAEHPLPRR